MANLAGDHERRDAAASHELARMARTLNLLTKLKLQELKGEKSQGEMIVWLSTLGCGPSEIADLLGTTSKSVNPVLSRARSADKTQKKTKNR